MAYGNEIFNKLNYNHVLCDHLLRISKSAESIFDVPLRSDGATNLSTADSRMTTFYGQVILLESFLYGTDLSKDYSKATEPIHERLGKRLDSDMKTFWLIQKIIRKLMQEANSKGLLFPERNLDETDDDEEEGEPSDNLKIELQNEQGDIKNIWIEYKSKL